LRHVYNYLGLGAGFPTCHTDSNKKKIKVKFETKKINEIIWGDTTRPAV
jgi:hypothetical protein